MMPSEIHGILLMFAQSLVYTAHMVSSRLMKQAGWPFYRIMAIVLCITSLCIICSAYIRKLALPEKGALKWLIGRGIFGATSFTLLTLSVRFGTPVGDAGALSSINTVIAALLGRLLLDERINVVHISAAIGCIFGAVLISKPRFVFGQSGSGSHAWIGYCLALAGGVSQAGIALCARKCGNTSLCWTTLAVTSVCCITYVALPSIGVLSDCTMLPVSQSPLEAIAWSALLCFLSSFATVAQNAAAKWCPVSVNATVGTGGRMFWGYMSELLVFSKEPELLTVFGALLMLSSVASIAWFQESSKQAAVGPSLIAGSFAGSSSKLDVEKSLVSEAEISVKMPQ